jgi:ribosome maturation factor RimP
MDFEKVWTVAQAAAEQNGCKLYDMEFVAGNHGRVLRVFIERTEGVSVNDCEAVSRTLNLHLDQGDLIPGAAYNLEVSSPGLDRILKRPEHFHSAIGSQIQLRVKTAPGGSQKQFMGKLVGADAEGIELDVSGTATRYPFSNIEKAKVVFEFVKNEKKNIKKH